MPYNTCNDGIASNSWRAPEGNPPRFQLVTKAVATGKRVAAEMLGEYLIPPIANFNVHVRESDDETVPPEDVDDNSSVPSPTTCGKVLPLCEASDEGNGVTSPRLKPSEYVKPPRRATV